MQLLLLAAMLIPALLFLLSQQNTLKAIKQENRRFHPGLVWLQLIPLFGQIWQFVVVSRIADAIKSEIAFRQEDTIFGVADASAVAEMGKRPTFAIGMAYCILITIGVILQFKTNYRVSDYQWVIMIGPLFSLSGMICWIIYWVKLAQYKTKLVQIA